MNDQCEIWSNDPHGARQCQLKRNHGGICKFEPPMSAEDWERNRYIPTPEEEERMSQ